MILIISKNTYKILNGKSFVFITSKKLDTLETKPLLLLLWVDITHAFNIRSDWDKVYFEYYWRSAVEILDIPYASYITKPPMAGGPVTIPADLSDYR